MQYKKPHPPLFIQGEIVNSNRAAIAKDVIAGVQAVNALERATYFAIKANNVINKKYSESGGLWYIKVAHGEFPSKKLGWKLNGIIYEMQAVTRV